MLEQVLKSGVARSGATQVTRGLMGALLGTPSRGGGGVAGCGRQILLTHSLH